MTAAELLGLLQSVHEYRPADLTPPIGLNGRDWRLMLHAAEQCMLAAGVVYQPVAGMPGLRRRAVRAKQAEGRSKRFAAAARRKIERATQLLSAAVGLADDPMERRRLEALELRRQNARVDSLVAMRNAGEKRPRGI